MPGGRPRLPESEKRKPVAFRFKPAYLAKLQAMAEREGRSMVSILYDAIDLYERRAKRGEEAA